MAHDVQLRDPGSSFDIDLLSGAINHALTADPLTIGTPVLGAPVLSTNYALIANGLTIGAPVLGTPVLQLNYGLIADAPVIGAPVLGSPVLTEEINYSLVANPIVLGAPELGSPVMMTNYALIAQALTIGAPVLGSPALLAGFVLAGVTRDSAGDPLGSCVVQLFRTADDVLMEEKVSEADGSFFFLVSDISTEHYIVAYKAGTPDRAGTTLNTLVAE